MTSLIERIKQSRRFRAECNGITFKGTLPTREQFYLFGRDGLTDAELARKVVDSWENVRESDLVEGGADDQVAFSHELFSEIIGDRQDWWRAIADEVIKKFNDVSDKKDTAEKNSRAGSKAKA